MGDLNYESINQLSQYLSLQDYERIRWASSDRVKDEDFHSFYNDEINSKGILEPKRILIPGEMLTSQELDDLYDAAYDNRPKITFNKELNGIHITSLLQTSVNGIDVGWHLNFENGWHGWTFQNGKQLSLVDILQPKTKRFSWKNQISKYIFQALKFKKSKEYSGDLFGTLTLDENSLPLSNSMTIGEKESLWNGATEFVFMQDGVYVILSSVQQGYAPVLVQLPMAFLKPEYQAFYGYNSEIISTKELPKEEHTSSNRTSEEGEIDIDRLNEEFLKNEDKIDTFGKGLDATLDTTKIVPGSSLSHITDMIEDTSEFLDKANDSFMSFQKACSFFGSIKNDTLVAKLTADIHTLMNDIARITKYEVKHEGVENVLTLGADFSDNITSLKRVKETSKYKTRKNVQSNIKHFKNARSAQLENTKNTITTLTDFGDTVKDFNPVAKIIIGGITTLVALVGIPFVALKIYQLSGMDKKLFSKFKLRRKRK